MEIKKDFYNDLPSMACEALDGIIKKYGKEEWFKTAWEEYRQHIKDSNMDTMKMPGFVFKKYIEEEKEEKVCEKNCPDYKGMEALHKKQCDCSCHKEDK